MSQHEQINHPIHYVGNRKFEPIEVIDDWELDYYLGNVVKYVSRWGRKSPGICDLEKALWYLQRKITILKKKEQDPLYEENSRIDIIGQNGNSGDHYNEID